MVTSTRELPELPALVVGTVAHRRRGPVPHAFGHRVYMWLVDVDDLPRPPWYLRWLAAFDPRDHLGGSGDHPDRDLRSSVERFLVHRDITLGAGSRVVMLANARVLGHVFDPLSVFWCFGADGTLRCVIAEVHNTYGERHAYLVSPGEDGLAHVDKKFYVSPFNDVTGSYTLGFDLDHDRVGVTVDLLRGGDTVFGATFEGTPKPATRRSIVQTALRQPLMPQRISLLIRLHGTVLWLRRLPIVDRPTHHQQEGV